MKKNNLIDILTDEASIKIEYKNCYADISVSGDVSILLFLIDKLNDTIKADLGKNYKKAVSQAKMLKKMSCSTVENLHKMED